MRRRLALALLLLASACPRETPPVDPRAHAEGLYLKGTSEYLQGQFEEALATFAQVRALHPTDARLPAAVGEVLLAQGRLRDALAEFEAAARLEPGRSTNWSRIGFIQAQLGEREAARTSLTRALSLNPDDYNALEEMGLLEAKAGRVDAAVEALTRAAQKGPERGRADLVVKAARLLADAGRGPEARLLLDKALQGGTVSAELAREAGDLAVHAGALREAVEAYRVAARLLPRDGTLWELIGEIYLRLDRPVDAQTAFRESLQAEERVAPHVALGKLALAQGDRKTAEAELAAAREAFQGRVPEALALADLLEALGRREEALAVHRRLAEEPEHAADEELQRATAQVARRLGDAALAAQACARLAARDAGARCP